MPKKNEDTQMLGLKEQLDSAGYKNKKIVELQLDFTLPPPVYGFHVTLNPAQAQRTIKLVREINTHPNGLEVVSIEGTRWVVAWSSVKFFVEE